jgi:hypothetical protein
LPRKRSGSSGSAIGCFGCGETPIEEVVALAHGESISSPDRITSWAARQVWAEHFLTARATDAMAIVR